MRLFGLKLNSLLVIAVAALLALGAISAFADDAPGDPPGDGVTVDDGDTDGEGEGHAFGRDHGQGKPDGVPPDDGDVGVLQENGHETCLGATERAQDVLAGLQDGSFFEDLDLPEQANAGLSDQGKEGVGKALEAIENCGMGADGVGVESEDHPGNGNAFGRGHGQGKPEGVPTNGGGDE